MLRYHSKKIATPHKHKDGRIFAIMALFVGLGSSAFWIIFPLILNNLIHSEAKVGFYYSFMAVLGLIFCLLSTVIFQRYSKIPILKSTLFVLCLGMIGMTAAENIWHLGSLDIIRAICSLFIGISLSLFVKEFATNSNLGLEEGRYYLYANIGWFLGPLLGGLSTQYFGTESVFIISSFFYFVALVILLHQHLKVKHKAIHHQKHQEGLKMLFKNITEYFKSREFFKVFLVALGLNFWWSIMFVYIPLQIETMGFPESIIGLTMSGAILPLILLEGWVGKKADKKGIKIYIITGFLILALMAFSFSFLDAWPVILLFAFALSNIGAALIEPLQEVYFFKEASKHHKEKLFGIYNSADPVANIIGPCIAGYLIIYGGLDWLWIGTAVILFLFFLLSFRIKD